MNKLGLWAQDGRLSSCKRSCSMLDGSDDVRASHPGSHAVVHNTFLYMCQDSGPRISNGTVVGNKGLKHGLYPEINNKHVHEHICIYTHTYMAASQQHRHCNRPGGLFATRLATESGVLRQTLHDKPIQDHSTLHRDPRQGFATEGPRQRFVTEGGGPRQTPLSRHRHIYIYIYVYMSYNIYIYIYYIIYIIYIYYILYIIYTYNIDFSNPP